MSYLRDYARQVAEFGSPLYRLLAEHGEDFTFSPLPEGETCGRAKACYTNATHRAIFNRWGGSEEDVTYYEGHCLDGGIPFPHAWCVKDGKVLELTLRHLDPRCPFCDGEGELHPTDHWDYDPPDDDEDEEYVDEAETIECEMCAGSGETEPRDRTDARYLGVPVDATTLRRIVISKGTYQCFDGPGFEMVLESLGITLESLAGVTE